MKRTMTENELKQLIKEEVMQAMAQAAPDQQNPGLKERAQRVYQLNKTLIEVKKEADALQLENVSKWIYMAIQSLDREFIGDTVSNGWNKAKEKVGRWLGNGQQQ